MSDSPDRRQAVRDGEETIMERTFVDHEGVHWRVEEQAFSEYDRRRGLSLIFASDAAVRRVRDYPADWHRMSVDDLIALSWKA